MMSIIFILSLSVGNFKVYADESDESGASDTTIQVGAYYQMGRYYDEPILWRCMAYYKITGYDTKGNPIVDANEKSTEPKDGYLPLMLSDKILCIKPFDAKGDNESGSHGRGVFEGPIGSGGSLVNNRYYYGSNYWSDSNIRDWLNSDAAAGKVRWSCGNPPDKDHVYNQGFTSGINAYDQEAGFLNDFTSDEKSIIKTVTQKQLLSCYERSFIKNENYHIFNSSFKDVIQNYDTAYSEFTTEKIFLLDVKQFKDICDDDNVDLRISYRGHCTEKAVENSQLQLGDIGNYWLRSPKGDSTFAVRVVRSNNTVYYEKPYDGIYGIRPAFFLDTEASKVTNGKGSETEPYIITKRIMGSCGENLKWELDTDGTLIISGTGNMDDYLSYTEQPWSNYKEEIYKVELRNGITGIGANAFSGLNISSINIPESVNYINNVAFENCTNLTEITIPDNTLIGVSAFQDCTNLKKAIIGKNSQISRQAFYNCTSLVYVLFDGDAPTISDESVFENTASNFRVYHTSNGSGWTSPLWNGIPCFTYGEFEAGGKNYIYLDDIMHGYIVHKNSNKVFTNDGDNVSVRDYDATRCNQVWKFVKHNDNSYKIISMQDSKCLDVYGGSSVSGNNVDVYQDNNSAAQKWYITLAENGNYMLKPECSDCLLDVEMGDSLIEDGTNVEIWEKNAGAAQQFEFETLDVNVLPKLDITESADIDNGIFTVNYTVNSKTPIKNIDIVQKTPAGNYEYSTNDYNGDVTVKAEDWSNTYGDYKITIRAYNVFGGYDETNSEFIYTDNIIYPVEGGNIYISKDGVVVKADKNVTEVKIPQQIGEMYVTKIGSNAFENCSRLSSVEMPAYTTEIGGNAFAGCTNLESAVIGRYVTGIGTDAFSGCSSLVLSYYKDSYAAKFLLIDGTEYTLIDESGKITSGDVDGDGILTILDATHILKKVSDPNYILPIEAEKS